MYHGKHLPTGIKVVVKSYLQKRFYGIFRELKLFTLIQSERQKNFNEEMTLADIIRSHKGSNDGLPEMLGYTI